MTSQVSQDSGKFGQIFVISPDLVLSYLLLPQIWRFTDVYAKILTLDFAHP